jgi:glycosyltransferase involved in cell wall biosynthesis
VTALSAELGLGPADHRFLGFRTDVADLLAAADFFVLPSRAEGLPISLLEAMSHHLPVVCTRVGGNPELVTDGVHGALVPAGDPEALAAAMERLALDPDLRRRQGEAGAARVHDEFSFDRTTDHYEAIYHRVLARRSTWPPPWSRA